jgi:C-terminal processing protease CtpA/Prc
VQHHAKKRYPLGRIGPIFCCLLLIGTFSAFQTPTAAQDPAGVEALTGNVVVTNPLLLSTFSETYMMLLDMTAYLKRDRALAPPIESQILAPVEGDRATGATFTMDLPSAPRGTINDVDRGQSEGDGVQIYSVEFWANLVGDPYIGPREGGGWGEAMSSLKVTVGDGDVVGGSVIVWSPDDNQLFPTGLGPDGVFLTDDDPLGPIPAGWTVVDLNDSPFTQIRTPETEITIIEGDDGFTDYGDKSFTDAFDALIQELRLRYPFTELKGIDWDELDAKYRPIVEQAEAKNDVLAFNNAIDDFVLEFPDGHVGASIPDERIAAQIGGRLGMRLAETDSGEVIVISVTEGLPADLAGIELGAEVTTWDGHPVTEAVADEPLLLTASTEHAKRLQQYEFLTRGALGDNVNVGFRNSSGDEQTVELTFSEDIDGRDMAANQAVSTEDLNSGEVPLDARQLDSGIGYIRISSFDADPVMMTTAWEYALNNFAALGAPALIIDMRDNPGGLGETSTLLAGSFYDQEFELDRLEFINAKGDSVDVGADDVIPAPVQWDMPVAVLIDADCVSACEIFVAALAENTQNLIVGYTPTGGVEAGIYSWNLPGDIYFQAPIESITRNGEVFIEGTGVAPNVEVPATSENLLNSDDEVLLTAEDALNSAIAAAGTPVPEGTPVG